LEENEWEVVPLEIKIRVLKKEKCFGDIGPSQECKECKLRQECLIQSFHNFLKAYDHWFAPARSKVFTEENQNLQKYR